MAFNKRTKKLEESGTSVPATAETTQRHDVVIETPKATMVETSKQEETPKAYKLPGIVVPVPKKYRVLADKTFSFYGQIVHWHKGNVRTLTEDAVSRVRGAKVEIEEV